jgi:hypothetical protein
MSNVYTESSVEALLSKVREVYGPYTSDFENRVAPKGVTKAEYTRDYQGFYRELIAEGYYPNRRPKSPEALMQQVAWTTTVQSITTSALSRDEGFQNTLLRNRVAAVEAGFMTEEDITDLFDKAV